MHNEDKIERFKFNSSNIFYFTDQNFESEKHLIDSYLKYQYENTEFYDYVFKYCLAFSLTSSILTYYL